MPDSVAAPVADKGVLARAIGVIVSPGSTFAAVVQAPRPALILLLVCLIFGLATGLPQFNDQVRRTALDQQVQQMERRGQTVTPEMYGQIERFSRYTPYATMTSMFIVLPIMSLIFTAIYWAVFNAILGGTATFKQVLAIVTHSQVIGALGAVAAMPIIYIQGVQTMAGPYNLGALAPMLEPTSTLATFLGAISFFAVWQTIVTAIGLGVLYKRKTTGIAIGLLVFYLVVTAGITMAVSSMTGR